MSQNPAARFISPGGRAIRWTFIGVVLIWSLFPIYWIIQLSLKRPVDSQSVPPVWFFQPTFDAFRDAFLQVPLYTQLRNSLTVAVAATVIALAVGVCAAYALTKLREKRSKDLEFWILSTRMAPPIAVAIPFYLTFRQIGMLDTIPALVAVHVLLVIGMVTWILIETFHGLPIELLEAAKVDGCTDWTAFRRVMLPLARSGMVGAGVISFLFSWNEFFFALILTSLNARTGPVGVFNFIGFQAINLNALAAASTLLLIPAFIVVFVFQKHLVRGMTMGAVKG
ncbi:carbohydrate ABC transporter permease [Saxibacter everestensis]|uniref:Carbohydrate ABC transporter permease n=1 Tax=Saxibacter everestensis TaxID=2909229 RepID=A0ABY8QZB9_9MICO|nr:carbohydrate ABC transporter permease [Brevibacteriaceae bacterium ZFBP1038]